MSDYRLSRWTYNTGASGSGSIGMLSASGGMIVLDDPAGTPQRFDFVSYGIGVGKRIAQKFRLPDISPKMLNGREIAGIGSPTDFDAAGEVYMTPSFHGQELSVSDLCGATNTIDVTGGFLIARGKMWLYAGIQPALMLAGIVNPAFMGLALNTAKARIEMRGISEGLIDGIAATSSIGVLEHKGRY